MFFMTKISHLSIPEVLLIEPEIFFDERGFFFESYNQNVFKNLSGYDINFVQDNHSLSKKGSLRGLHLQHDPYAQSKLIRVIEGEIFDVAVDLRENSKTFGTWVSLVLSSSNKKQLFIPKGFAHGFLALSETAEVLYKTDKYYNKEAEIVYNWNDPKFNISWPSLDVEYSFSAKDKIAPYI